MPVYLSQMFQAVPALVQVCRITGGCFVSSRASTLAAVRRHYPEISAARFSKKFRWLRRGNRLLNKAGVIVTGSPYKKLLKPYSAKKCMVFHGTYMFITRQAIEENAHFDLLCVTGPRMQSMLGRHPDIRLNCVMTGFLPFAEYPERNAEAREHKLLSMGLNPEKKTVIYTPSRKSIGSWDLLVEKLITGTPRHYNLILRPHPSQSLTARLDDRSSFRKMRRLCRERGDAVLDLVDNRLPDVLAVSDLVVSDANSPAEESLFYDLPQLFIESPLHSRDRLFNDGLQQGIHAEDLDNLMLLYECGMRFWAEDNGLANAIERALASSGEFSSARSRYFAWVFGARDRTAPQKVAAAIDELLVP
ncbi:MAG: hypothetical protein RQ723_02115 [Desulfuromonadales bacterium]|nr:hypothetical protein [Desulfuromonadales bacterium]